VGLGQVWWGGIGGCGPYGVVAPGRLSDLDRIELAGCSRVFVARSWQARLLGLAWLDELPSDCGLLIPGCRSVHTFGMRFALDVVFLGANGETLRVARAVPPRRVLWCRGAAAVLERPASGFRARSDSCARDSV
jgi:uncharacterized protein